jgi:signal transduction histidine kinase
MSSSVLGQAAPVPLRVLLVEDNLDDAILLRRHLQRAGFAPAITRVETAEAMLEELRTGDNTWDIILADYNLPNFSAPEALQLLKSTGFDIPFIVMSGAVNEETAVAAMRAGAHDYVSKGNLARLFPAIERELAEAKSRRSKQAAERALVASEERFHRLVEATPLPLLLSNRAGELIYWNRAAARLLCLEQEVSGADAPAVTLDQLFPPIAGARAARSWTPEHAWEALAAISSEHPGETVERTCTDRTGRQLPVLLGASRLNPEADDRDQQLAAFLVDLSEQKRAEEVLRRTEKLAAAGRLAASIAHEINNPLEAITNCIYLLAQLPLPEHAQSFVALAQGELNRVTHITTQTLRFYRQTSRATSTAIAELFETVLTLYEARLRSHGVQVVRDFRTVPAINAFAGEIRQVLANLFGNALDALVASDGVARSLVLRVHPTRMWATGTPAVAVVVADTGIGMSQSTLRRIYEPFFSTKGSTGTGLGLWVTLEIVSKHHGFLRARSRNASPSGTVFRLVLPVDGTPEPAQADAEPVSS